MRRNGKFSQREYLSVKHLIQAVLYVRYVLEEELGRQISGGESQDEYRAQKVFYVYIVKEEDDALYEPADHVANAIFPQPDDERIDTHKREQQTN